MKVCKKCGLPKESGEFYRQKDTRDGLHAYCKPCHKQVRDEGIQRNLERHRAMRRAYAKRPEVREKRKNEQRRRRATHVGRELMLDYERVRRVRIRKARKDGSSQ